MSGGVWVVSAFGRVGEGLLAPGVETAAAAGSLRMLGTSPPQQRSDPHMTGDEAEQLGPPLASTFVPPPGPSGDEGPTFHSTGLLGPSNPLLVP